MAIILRISGQFNSYPIGKDQAIDEDGGIMIGFKKRYDVHIIMRWIVLDNVNEEEFFTNDLPCGLVFPEAIQIRYIDVTAAKRPDFEAQIFQWKGSQKKRVIPYD